MWIEKFDRLPQGKVGQLIIQMVHGLAFDASLALAECDISEEDMPAQVKMIKELAIMLERTERAASLNQEREKELKKQIAEDLAKHADKPRWHNNSRSPTRNH